MKSGVILCHKNWAQISDNPSKHNEMIDAINNGDIHTYEEYNTKAKQLGIYYVSEINWIDIL